MHAPPRVAIAGAGAVAAVHAHAARAAGATLVGIAASTPARSRAAATRLGAERAFDTAEQLCEADGIDVVHLCTPNHLHLPLAQRAFATGKHVICEKPLAVDLAGAHAMLAAQAAAGTVGAVPFAYRYYATAREARERVRRGDTGALALIHGSYLQDWLLTPADDDWRVDAALGGASRAFADIGSHWCDLAELLSGHRIARLCARTATAVAQRGPAAGETRVVSTEDVALVQFETDRGALGSLVVSQVSAGRKNRLWLQLDGAHEALAFDQENAESLWCGERDRVVIRRRDPTTMSPPAARLAVLPAGHPQGYQDCFNLFVADVYEAVGTGVAPDGMPTLQDGLRAAQLTDAVIASAREQTWVDVAAPDAQARPAP